MAPDADGGAPPPDSSPDSPLRPGAPPPESTPTSTTRRAVLAGGAVALGGPLVGRSRAQSDPAGVGRGDADTVECTVLSQNLSLGVDFTGLAAARTAEEVPGVVGDLLSDIDASHPAARLRAVADEIEAHTPELVGLQEVALVRTGQRGGAAASTVRYDFLDTLLGTLRDRGLDYEVAVVGRGTDVEMPAAVDGERLDVRLTDRDVLLARGDVSVDAPRTETFESLLRAPVGGETLTLARGYAACEVRIEEATFTAATTHLESTGEFIREAQAGELRDGLDAERLVLVGDFNSAPGGPAYETLAADFEDAWAATRDAAGPTCCQASRLTNDESRLSRRIDHVFVRGGIEPTATTRVGTESADRVELADGGRIWPSDHAGVLSTLRVAAAPPSPEPTSTPDPSSTSAPPSTPPTAPTRTPSEPETGSKTSTAPTTTSTTAPATRESHEATEARETTEADAPGFGVAGALGALALAAARLWSSRD